MPAAPSFGTAERPLRVAIVGAGPAGFYAAEHLLRHDDPVVEVDLYDRLPTPFGLVRSGVAPDHPKIKSVTRVFEKVADHPRFRFFGNVCFGEHLGLEELEAHYHQLLFTTGAQTDRSLGIPGEDLAGSHSATEFVAWYNGHPEFRDHTFDLSAERAVVVGVGNVAVDVARILCRTPEELEQTDIADYALEALRESRLREVVMLGRRGPVQAAFTLPEVKELGEMADADVAARPEEVALDPLSQAALAAAPDRSVTKMVELLQEYARRAPSGKRRRIVLRFLVSPTEILGDGAGRVRAVRIIRNALVEDGKGGLRAQPTGEEEEIEAGLVFRSVGYRGVALAGVPFHESGGVVPNAAGRVLDAAGQPIPGLYVAGWIKRGPMGVIGTNKPDAQETVAAMLEDAARGATLQPAHPEAEAAERLVRAHQPDVFVYDDWRKLDAHELAQGAAKGRPRLKLCRVEDMLAALERRASSAPAP
ncbi:MAG TPA: FAD-dependent oxidoreductase [Rubricoccaceae bacterium]|nr:FAD-dependent oxidoreductase [Rubricoccaceae bacterium]